MFSLQELVDYCMAKPGVTQEFPFDKKTMVFKLMGKMFALANIESWHQGLAALNLKNDPQINKTLREHYASIIPGYHMNKKHWNTIQVSEEELEQEMIYTLIDQSYEIVKSKLAQKYKKTLL